jgi:hypothetical protein
MFRHGGHVLIVEDNPMNQKVGEGCREALRDDGGRR